MSKILNENNCEVAEQDKIGNIICVKDQSLSI